MQRVVPEVKDRRDSTELSSSPAHRLVVARWECDRRVRFPPSLHSSHIKPPDTLVGEVLPHWSQRRIVHLETCATQVEGTGGVLPLCRGKIEMVEVHLVTHSVALPISPPTPRTTLQVVAMLQDDESTLGLRELTVTVP